MRNSFSPLNGSFRKHQVTKDEEGTVLKTSRKESTAVELLPGQKRSRHRILGGSRSRAKRVARLLLLRMTGKKKALRLGRLLSDHRLPDVSRATTYLKTCLSRLRCP